VTPDLPPLMHLGDALRWFRTRYGLNQAQAGIRMGFAPSTAQRLISMRERPADAHDYVEVSISELVNLEDASDVERGTILKHAGYVSTGEMELPPELSAAARAGVMALIEADLAHNGVELPERKQRRSPRIRPRQMPDES
jgi:transcriptional regulator with XRE-family HTH domain